MEQLFMDNKKKTSNLTHEQISADWAYAARRLQKGEAPDKIVKDMAAFRKELADPQKYAQTTVAKVQNYLDVQKELGSPAQEQPKENPDYTQLDKSLKQVSAVEFARRLYDDGGNRDTVVKSLQQDRRIPKKEAPGIARDAETRFLAERDLNYAVRARERGEPNDRIIPKIAQYRTDKVPDPQSYARAIVETADRVREAEKDSPTGPQLRPIAETAQEQYRRDLHHAVFQLENRPRDEVRLEIAERRPDKAYDSPSFRLHGQPDHSYAVAVLQQAEKIREMTDKGRNLEDTLDVAQREFGRHVQEAFNAREAGKTSSETVERISQGAPSQEFYARAVVNQAESIREHQREASIRPEMARAAIDNSMTYQQQTPSQPAPAAVER